MIYSRGELEEIGFAQIGENVTIHKTVEFFSADGISLGNNVRIDCFSLLSAGDEGIHIGSNVHLAASSFIFGSGGRVILEDFAGFASRVSLYTASDDYSEGFLTNPTVPEKYKKVTRGPVTLRRHVIIGVGSVIMPNVEIGVGASIGALTFVNENVGEFMIGVGNPMRILGKRSESILEREKMYLDEIGNT